MRRRFEREGWSDPATVFATSSELYDRQDDAERWGTLREQALDAWQIADDELLPLGYMQDLLGKLIRALDKADGWPRIG